MTPRGIALLALSLLGSVVIVYFPIKMGILGDLYRQFASRNYFALKGTIIHAEVRETNVDAPGSININIGKVQRLHEVNIRYRYDVEGHALEGERFRYNKFPYSAAERKRAISIVEAHVPGSEVIVFYNPADVQDAVLSAGVSGRDVILMMFLGAFYGFVGCLWIVTFFWFKQNFFSNVAGGVKIHVDGDILRVWLPRFLPSLIALGFISLLLFLAIFPLGTNPSFGVALTVCVVIVVAGGVLYGWLWRKMHSEDYCLVIDRAARRLILPKGFGRAERLALPFDSITDIISETLVQTNRGNITRVFVPTLHTNVATPLKLVVWRERRRAELFVDWLRKQIDLN